MRTLHGIAASPGIVIGPLVRVRMEAPRPARGMVTDPAAEWARVQVALAQAKTQLTTLQTQLLAHVDAEEAAIFRAHALMLDDPVLLQQVRQHIEERHSSAEAALHDAAEGYIRQLDGLADPALRARAADLRDVVARLQHLLSGVSPAKITPPAPSILAAADLLPSEVASLDRACVLGICTSRGGPTSHAAILARALGIPAVMGLGDALWEIPDGTLLILDGGAGVLWIAPDQETLGRYKVRQNASILPVPQGASHGPAVTRDRHRVRLLANLSGEEDVQAALDAGAEGVGVLRTEFLYLNDTALPGEASQVRAYEGIAACFAGLPVGVRLLDLGGEKALPGVAVPHAANPALGQRGVRLSLAYPELLLWPQLRALLRVAGTHDLRVLLPMVTTVAEVRAVRDHLATCSAALAAAGVAVPDRVQLGAMIEVPAAALLADQIAAEVDFLSVGTNDLTQYTLAADRTHPAVAELAGGLQPAVLRLLDGVVRAAHVQGCPVELCGELAGDPLAVPVLVGLGVDALSMAPAAIPRVRAVVRGLTLDAARAAAQEALLAEDAAAAEALVRARFLNHG